METMIPTEQQSIGRGRVARHYAHVGWQLLSGTVAVVAGFSTQNMTLADSGLAVLNQHATSFTTLFTRLMKQ